MADVDIWQDEAGSFLNRAWPDCLASCSPRHAKQRKIQSSQIYISIPPSQRINNVSSLSSMAKATTCFPVGCCSVIPRQPDPRRTSTATSDTRYEIEPCPPGCILMTGRWAILTDYRTTSWIREFTVSLEVPPREYIAHHSAPILSRVPIFERSSRVQQVFVSIPSQVIEVCVETKHRAWCIGSLWQ